MCNGKDVDAHLKLFGLILVSALGYNQYSNPTRDDLQDLKTELYRQFSAVRMEIRSHTHE